MTVSLADDISDAAERFNGSGSFQWLLTASVATLTASAAADLFGGYADLRSGGVPSTCRGRDSLYAGANSVPGIGGLCGGIFSAGVGEGTRLLATACLLAGAYDMASALLQP